MVSNKAVLIITPYFAPQSHAAVFRAYKLAKYLPAYGWEVHILTVDKNYLYNEDQRLLTDLPTSVKIHTATYIEPTLRGLRMAMGGQDRSFKAVKSEIGKEVLTANKKSTFKKIYDYFRRKLNSPDPYWTWKNNAIRKGEEIIKRHNISVVMTSSLPYTTIEIANELKIRTNIKWVADFRDPMTYDSRLHSSDRGVFFKQKQIEYQAMCNADVVTTLTSAHPLILADTYGPDLAKKATFIPTGLDTNLLPNDDKPMGNYIIFIGEFLSQYGGEFFKIFEKMDSVTLKVVGYKEINKIRMAPFIKQVENRIEFIDHLPQKDVYALVKSAKAAVICTARNYPWWTSFAKLVDYIALRKPVIAIVPDPSEARKWLQLTGLGIFLDESVEVSAAKVNDFLKNPIVKPVEEHCRKFESSFQVDEFEKVFNSCLKA